MVGYADAVAPDAMVRSRVRERVASGAAREGRAAAAPGRVRDRWGSPSLPAGLVVGVPSGAAAPTVTAFGDGGSFPILPALLVRAVLAVPSGHVA